MAALERGRKPSLQHLAQLFAEAEAAGAADPPPSPQLVPASGVSPAGGGTVTPPLPSPQHAGLQPPAALHHPSLGLHRPSLGSASQHQLSLGQLDRAALQQRGRLAAGLPRSLTAKVHSKASSCKSLDRLTGSSGGYGTLAAVSPQPLLPYSDRVAAQLRRRCAKAQAVLASLQAPRQGTVSKPPLPAAALRFCEVSGRAGAGGARQRGAARVPQPRVLGTSACG